MTTVRGSYTPPSAFQVTWQFNMLSELTALCGLSNRNLSGLTALGGSGSKGKRVKTENEPSAALSLAKKFTFGKILPQEQF